MRTAHTASLVFLLLAAPAGAQRAPLWDVGIEERELDFMPGIAAEGKVVFVSGQEVLDDGLDTGRAIVAALDARTGAPIWVEEGEAATANPAGANPESVFTQVVAAKRAVIVGGYREVEGDPEGTVEGMLRSYDRKTGGLRWSHEFANLSFQLVRVAVTGNVVLLATTFGTAPTNVFIGAYDLTTGTPLWDDTYASAASPSLLDIAASGRFVAIVGEQLGDGDPGDSDLYVRTYDAKTGAPGWNETFGEDDRAERGTVAIAKGRRLFVGGSTRPIGENENYLVRAYDFATGAAKWTQTTVEANDFSARALALSGSTLVSFSDSSFAGGTVRAHDVKTGIVRWDEDVPGTGIVFGVAAKGRRVVVPQPTEVLGFDLKNGATVFEGTTANARAAAISGKSAFVVTETGAAAFDVR
jgi:outer membrane protein assembly factor BamB